MVAWQFILMILLSGFLLVFFLYRPVKITAHDDANISINSCLGQSSLSYL